MVKNSFSKRLQSLKTAIGKIAAAALVLSLLPGLGAASEAATFRVTSGADTGTGTLRQAVTSANANGERNVIEVETSVREIQISSTIVITGDVTVNGHGTTVRGARITRLFSVDSGGRARFDSLTLTDGYPLSESGGAVYIDSTAGGKADFVNCTFFRNRAGGNGGAVYVYGAGSGTTTFTNCTLTGNEAAGDGGGVAVSGGAVEFNASIVTGNVGLDVYSDPNGIVSNAGRHNVIGETNVAISFPTSRNNFTAVQASNVFSRPDALTQVDGVNVIELLSATGNVALDMISADSAAALALPNVDERGAPRPQMFALDAGAYELSPVALSGIELIGGTYVQRGTVEQYDVSVLPADATLDVRNYEDGVEWTALNPAYAEVIAVDRFGRVTGLAAGEASVRAVAHGWTSRGEATTAAVTKSVRVGEDPLPAPTVGVTFTNPRATMALNTEQTLSFTLKVTPADTPCTLWFESTDPTTATVLQSGPSARTAVVRAHRAGQTTIRIMATARNSRGESTAGDAFTLTVAENVRSGGGGCDAGFGAASLALAGFLLLRRRLR
ncbi:MAG: Ig-like domain-containing protein [Synergistaceae bacterium]|jgi:predicted outer membrane repeat protein|nr:Ig-like domain-containing protein [Synergistaceae bacterium]